MSIYKTTCFFGTKISKNNMISYVTKNHWNSFVNFYIKDIIPSFIILKHIDIGMRKRINLYFICISL